MSLVAGIFLVLALGYAVAYAFQMSADVIGPLLTSDSASHSSMGLGFKRGADRRHRSAEGIRRRQKLDRTDAKTRRRKSYVSPKSPSTSKARSPQLRTAVSAVRSPTVLSVVD
uniref:Secreted protein n=1 Tax=Panagrellus redivivus TaxID=6233 RepID=A0A7E4UNF4_PANRE